MSVRSQLFLKLWWRSAYCWLILLSIPVVAIILYNSGTYERGDLASILYEKVAPIYFIFLLQWCFSIDFDSKFYSQMITYPIKKWKFLLERVLFATVLFGGLLALVTLVLTPSWGSFLWKSIAFTIPIYLAISGIVLFGTKIGNHSLGGLIAGLCFWMFYLFGGIFLKDFNVILLVYQSVERFVAGESPFFGAENHWILYNRLCYVGVGVLCMIGALLITERKK